MSFEDRLRRSLQARADDVTPDPAMYSVVQSRIRRARTFRFALAGAAATLAIAGVAIAAPNLINNRIEFEPGPVASQPPAEATEAPSETEAPTTGGTSSGAMVFTDGEAVYSAAVDGESAEELIPSPCDDGSDCDYEPVRSVAALPGSTSDDTTVVAAYGCDGLRVSGFDEAFMADTCPASVTFSPDGRHIAWLGQVRVGGDWMLHTADWTPDGPADAASFGLDIQPGSSARIEDWVFSDVEGEEARGWLYLRVAKLDTDDSGIYRLGLDRQADGELAVPSTDLEQIAPDAGVVLAFASVTEAEAEEAAQYRLEIGNDRIVRTIGKDDSGVLPLPDEFGASSTGDAGDSMFRWISAAGDTLLFGDGVDAWVYDWSATGSEPVAVDVADLIDHAVLVPPLFKAEDTGSDDADLRDVDVFFGMTGHDACVADQRVEREVAGLGVARGALTELLEGPSSRESNEGIVSPFNANTAGALRDIKIVDGQARVDFTDFSDAVENDSCTKSAILDSLNKTLFQFSTVESTLYSFDGDVEAWNSWLGTDAQSPPAAVIDTQEAIYDAAVGRDWKRLHRLSDGTSCTLSDQPEPCVPYWKEQEANGKDPLGVMVDLLSGPVTKNPNAPIWVYPPEWADPNSGYGGPRIGIGEDGAWRYFVLEGG